MLFIFSRISFPKNILGHVVRENPAEKKIYMSLFDPISHLKYIFFLMKKSDQTSGGLVARLARDAYSVQCGAGVAYTQPIQGRIGRHDARP